MGLADVGVTAAVADSLVKPFEDGRLADSSNIFIKVNEIMK